MSKMHGHSWLLIGMSIMLTVIAVLIVTALPNKLEQQERNHLRSHARSTGSLVSQRFGSRMVAGDRDAQLRADDLLQSLDGLVFYLVLDSVNRVVVSYNESDENSDQKVDAESLSMKTVIPIREAATPGRIGTLYIGQSRSVLESRVRSARLYLRCAGLLILLTVLGILVTVWSTNSAQTRIFKLRKAQRKLTEVKGSLESEVAEHRSSEVAARASEKRYKYLLENAMKSTFQDLEDLNLALEKRKTELEAEVRERTQAQKELSVYSSRLESLNEIGRFILSGRSVEDIVDIALNHLEEVIDFDRASVVEFNPLLGDGTILGVRSSEPTNLSSGCSKPASFFRGGEGKGETPYYERDIRTLPDPSDVEKVLWTEGIRSYGRILLTVADEIVGTLNIGSSRPDHFTDADLQVLRDIGDLISIAIRQNRYNDERDRHEAELIEARDSAEEMVRLKSAFLTNMSHEIRTPLSGIIGFAQVLQEELEGEFTEFADLIQESARRLLATINSVLDLAKLQSENVLLECKDIDLFTSVEESVRLLKPLADAKGLVLTVSGPGSEARCMLDASGIERIVNNLVGNAIKFTSEGSVSVRVERDEENAILTVSDTGVGISESFLPKLFDEFRQEEMGSDRQHEGSGLGMAITRRLVEKMGGKIDVESTRGRGSTFTIRFELVETIQQRKEDASVLKRVLVVSPYPESELLRNQGLTDFIEVRTAPDFQKAIQLAREEKFDLLIVDADEYDPSSDQKELDMIRHLEEYSSVAFIAVSSHALSEFEEHYLEIGFDGMDVDPDGIDSFLKRLFDRLRYQEKRAEKEKQAEDSKQAEDAKRNKASLRSASKKKKSPAPEENKRVSSAKKKLFKKATPKLKKTAK